MRRIGEWRPLVVILLAAAVVLPKVSSSFAFTSSTTFRIRPSISVLTLSSSSSKRGGEDEDNPLSQRRTAAGRQQRPPNTGESNEPTTPTTNPQKKKSGRFAQSVHLSRPASSSSSSSSSKSTSAKQQQLPMTDSKPRQPRASSSSTSSSSLPSSSTFASKTTSSTFAPSSKPPPPPSAVPKSSDYMWKSDKSIEDLEQTMKQRWGTRADRWTADPKDYEDDDGGDDDEEGNANKSPSGRASKSATTTTTTTFRHSKPVLDPWQPPPPASLSSPRQQRFDDADDDSDEYEDDGDDEEEFYDEDDEGYEPPKKSSTTLSKTKDLDWNLNHMIQPKPAGGKGTKSLLTGSSGGSSSSSQSFFLPRQNLDAAVPANGQSSSSSSSIKNSNNSNKKDELSPEKPKSRSTPAIPPLDPVLDDSGNPIFLTLEQAQRNFAAISVPVDVQDNDDDDDQLTSTEEQPDASLQKQSSSSSSAVAAVASTWQELGITSKILLDNLNAMGCSTPLAVQLKACSPILLGSSDVVVGTYTGSGKTLAVLVPLVQRLLWQREQETFPTKSVEVDHVEEMDYTLEDEEATDETDVIEDSNVPKNHVLGEMKSSSGSIRSHKAGVQVLIVVPGRELASQMVSVARSLLQGTDLVTQLAIGGTTLARNWDNIRKRKPDILIGTPGRLAELVLGPPGEKNGRLKIGGIQSFVLDEFDALLQYKANRDPTQGLLEFLKRRHRQELQCVFCSATAGDMLDSPNLNKFLRPGFVQAMTDRDDVLVTPQSSNAIASTTRMSRTIIHGAIHIPHRRFALETLRKILHTEPLPQQILIFAENPRRVDIVIEKLEEMGIVAAPLHGGMGSEKVDRAEVSKALREGYVGIVVATELAARGLDAPLLTHVINLELPTDASHYAHRAGRCGRGGRPGVVINITTNSQERNVPHRFAQELGIVMHTVEPRNGKLNIVNAPTSTTQPVTL